MKAPTKVNYYSDCLKKSLKVNVTVYDPNGACSMRVQGTWDTGATCTAISKSVAKQLNLKPLGRVPVETAGGTIHVQRYLVGLRIEGLDVTLFSIAVEYENLQKGEGKGLLIGMDIITKGDFVISNQDGKTSLSFRVPAGKRIEF